LRCNSGATSSIFRRRIKALHFHVSQSQYRSVKGIKEQSRSGQTEISD
jgi:hypothetical protein